jgi:hypothetical protein
MATLRAMMKGDYQFEPATGDGAAFTWCINWVCWPLDGSGEYFDLSTKTVILTGDTAAQVVAKIITSAVSAATARQPTDTLPRTNVYYISLTRGS